MPSSKRWLSKRRRKISALADLDAVKKMKPDTSEADGLRKELQALKDQHQAALKTAQQESAKATEEQLATKSALEKLQAELGRQKAESSSDYRDMHESFIQLVEEANKKAVDAEARLKETEAIVKVKDAELAEAKAKNAVPKTPTGGLAASKYADENEPDSPSAKQEAVEVSKS